MNVRTNERTNERTNGLMITFIFYHPLLLLLLLLLLFYHEKKDILYRMADPLNRIVMMQLMQHTDMQRIWLELILHLLFFLVDHLVPDRQ